MKAVWSIGLCMFLLTACLREHDNMEDCRADLFFKSRQFLMFSKGESLPDTGLIISLSSNWICFFRRNSDYFFLSV